MPPRKKIAHRALDVLVEQHWAMLPSALEQMLAIVTRDNLSPEAVAAKLGRPLDNTRRVTVRDGVATVPVRGPLFRYANLFTEISGATSYEILARDLTTALEDPNVRVVLLAIDSPGGEVNGCQEFAELVFEARKQKTIVAHVSGLGASGAYWIASAAGRVVASETAIIGSIGCAATFVDTKGAEEMAGVRVIDIISSQSPKKHPDPADDAGRSQIQRTIDALAAVFVSTVARNRSVDDETVLSNYGQGDVFVGAAAVTAGLADQVATYEELHAELADVTGARRIGADANHKELVMPEKDKQVAPAAAETPAAEPATPPTPAPEAPAKPETEPAAEPTSAAPAVDPVARERERILAIEKLDGPKELIQRCKEDPACTVEQAALRINEAQKATREARVTALKQDEAKLDAPAPLDPGATEATSDEALARQIVATGQLVFGRAKTTTPADKRS